MQDRFKFRIFDKEQKKIVTTPRHFNFGIVNGTVVLLESCPTVAGFYNKRIAKEYDDVILMQCTGLKDKNNKLIYEGDIVSVKVETQDFFGEDEYYSKNYKGEIIFEKGEIAIDVIDTTKHPISLYYHAKDCEIIGNIYENPELLENKQWRK